MLAERNSKQHRLAAVLIAGTVILAPILSFSVQPMTGKSLLPVLGGTATTWLSSLIFFQACVLIGYLAAFATVRLSVAKQVILVALLAMASLFFMQLPPSVSAEADSVALMLLGLSKSMLLPISFLFMLGIVLHDWLAVYRGSIPWYLYALSNFGSILALLAYPFFIEPNLSLYHQSIIWKGILGVVVSIVLILCWMRLRVGDKRFRDMQYVDAASVPLGQLLQWLVLAFFSCLLFMAGTRELTAELGSHPLAWVIPLALYLGSFSLTFSGLWSRRVNSLCGILFTILFTCYNWKQGLAISALDSLSILFLLASVGTGCAFLNGSLYHRRSQSAYASFYIMIATGGCAAGLFSTLLAPSIFDRNSELFVAGFAAMALTGYGMGGIRPLIRIAAAIIFLLPSVWFINRDISNLYRKDNLRTFHFFRTIYSQNILTVQPGRIAITSESTLHGSEIVVPGLERMPTTYYHKRSPIGMVFEFLDKTGDDASRGVGVVGLGAGTLADYGREGDNMTFWDIDPMMLDVANDFFSYLKDSPANIHLELADGRVGIRDSGNVFDMLVLDAFAGDAVPTHLLTEEAYGEYVAATPNGWIVFHISSRWLDLTPVLQANMEAFGHKGVRILSVITDEEVAKYLDFSHSLYLIIPPSEVYEEFLSYLRKKSKSEPFIDSMLKVPSKGITPIRWVDGQHSVTDLIEWSKFL